MRSIEFQPTDRTPMDLGGMASTGISCFAYPKLVEALGLPARLPRIHDPYQMLALPDPDVLDVLDCDVVTVFWDSTNAFEQPELWHPYDFNGRLPALVRSPDAYTVLDDGTITQGAWNARMPVGSYVFTAEHGGQSLDFMETGELPLADLKELRRNMEATLPRVADVKVSAEICRRVRETTDRAIFYNGPVGSNLSIGAMGGMAVFPIICLMHPDYVMEYHEIMTDCAIKQLEIVLPEIAPYVDILMVAADDWGTQQSTIASPAVYRDLFLPYYRRFNDAAHRIAPSAKTFLHSCGAIYDILDYVIESHFDILNPVQWIAGGHSYTEWKDKCRGRIAMWGGGVDSQTTLPLGTVSEVEEQVAAVAAYLSQDGGYVYNGCHNLLAEIAPEKIIAMYRTAARVMAR